MTVVSGFEKIVRLQQPLAERTWLKLGGPAQFFAEPNSVDELAALVRRCCDVTKEIDLINTVDLLSVTNVIGTVLNKARY